jgi:hypothetical protein
MRAKSLSNARPARGAGASNSPSAPPSTRSRRPKKDGDLDALRGRDDFQHLLAELEAKK